MDIDLCKRDPIYRSVANSVRNAVMDFSPPPLPANKYVSWETFFLILILFY